MSWLKFTALKYATDHFSRAFKIVEHEIVEHLNHWHDRRLGRLLLYFYLAIFKLTSVRLHTFAYNSRTV